MPVRNMGETDSVPRGEWTTVNQEVPEGIYFLLHVTAPQMMVLAKVATTSEQMQDKVATVTKFIMGFDDHANVFLFPKSLLPKNFNLRSINANEGLLIKCVTGNSLKNAGTLFLKVSLGHTWFKIEFQVCDNTLAYPLIRNDF